MKQYDLAFKLIVLGASVNVENDSLACVAVEMGDIELLKKILELGADIKGTDYWGNLFYAALVIIGEWTYWNICLKIIFYP